MYPQLFGKYVLERELARGGMARVVLATLRGAGGFEKRLVVKQIRDELASDDDFVRRFVEEAKTTVALAHPNIVPVYELGVEQGTYFLAMEYVEGASLTEVLRAGTGTGCRLSPEEGAYVGVEVCRALDYAHRRMNVVHRDVTPRNAMVDEEGQVKVIDFGIAAPVATAPSGQGVFGSPGHMPPEQMEGKVLTPAADVFGVAVLLMELWSGRAPFRRRTPEETTTAMSGGHPKASEADIRLLPLDDIIARSMALDSDKRPQHADELARALRKFLSGVDLGDVARQLGERVRHARSEGISRSAGPKPLLQRPASRPTATQVGSKTFAAREELVISPGGAEGPSTRKLAPTTPPPFEAGGGATNHGDVRRHATAPLSEPSEVGPSVAIPATRPLAIPETRHEGSRRVRRSFVWAGPPAAALVATAFLIARSPATAWTDRPSPRPAEKPATGAPSTLTAAPLATASSTAALRDAPVESSAPVRATHVETAVVETHAGPGERGQLLLLGEGTYVSVDGVPRGPAPARLAVEPGAHTVLFTFPATGESKGTALVVRARDRSTVSADFTGVQPTIRVHR